MTKWTVEEEEYLKTNYENMTYAEIGEQIGKDKRTVQKKAVNMGLKKKEAPEYHKKQDARFVHIRDTALQYLHKKPVFGVNYTANKFRGNEVNGRRNPPLTKEECSYLKSCLKKVTESINRLIDEL